MSTSIFPRLMQSVEQMDELIGKEPVVLVLDCEFTDLSMSAKLISLALASRAGNEFYVELTDTYCESECNDFVRETVLPQLEGGEYACSLHEARERMAAFLGQFKKPVKITTDAPTWDWPFFLQLAATRGKLPRHVQARPEHILELLSMDEGVLEQEALPHHALLDARMIAQLLKPADSRDKTHPHEEPQP